MAGTLRARSTSAGPGLADAAARLHVLGVAGGDRLVRSAESQHPFDLLVREIRDRIAEIIETGNPAERKAMCEALLAELRNDPRARDAGDPHPARQGGHPVDPASRGTNDESESGSRLSTLLAKQLQSSDVLTRETLVSRKQECVN
jgi:hypothetical protein